MTRLFILLALLAPAALAAEPTFDPELARLQAAEAAIRAGATRPRQQAIQNTAPRQMNTEAAPARVKPVDGFLPLPPRGDGSPRAAGVQALIAAGAARPAPKPAEPAAPTDDDVATAEGLAALDAARRNRGLSR